MKSIAQFPSAVRGAAALIWEQRPVSMKVNEFILSLGMKIQTWTSLFIDISFS